MTHRATYALMMIVVVLVATWLMSSAGDDDDAGAQRAVMPAADEMPEMPRMLPMGEGAAPEEFAQPSELAPDAGGSTTSTPRSEPSHLILRVTHADGEAARGAEVELYDAALHFLTRGRLDALGSWHDVAREGAGVAMVLGGTASVERFDLPELSGRHELTLPDGEVVSGRLLVNGEPPGERVPLNARVEGAKWFSWKDFEGRPWAESVPGRWPPSGRHGLLTDADGSFRVSGLTAGDALKISFPESLDLLEDFSTPLPVIAPASGVVLEAVRLPVLRGRLIDLEGRPAGDAELRLGVQYHDAPSDPADGPTVRGGSVSYSWHPVADDGCFEISLGFVGTRRGRTGPDGKTIWDPDPIREDIQFAARDPDGNWLERSFEDIDTSIDHDVGDIPLQPAQRWRLRVVDTEGVPIATAKLRPSAEGPAGRVIEADDEGRIDLDLGVGGTSSAMLVADSFEARLLELPVEAPDEVQDIVLPPSTRVSLRLHGAWDDPALSEGWNFVFTARGAGAAYHDALLARAYEEDAAGPDDMRASPEGASGSGWGSSDDGTIWAHQYMRRPTLLFDGLRAHHPLTLLVAVRKAPEGFDNASTDYIWQQDVWLEPGQLREIDVDLSEWFPRR